MGRSQKRTQRLSVVKRNGNMWCLTVLIEAKVQLLATLILAQIEIPRRKRLTKFLQIGGHGLGIHFLETGRVLGHVLEDVLAFLHRGGKLLFFANSFCSDFGWPQPSLRTFLSFSFAPWWR